MNNFLFISWFFSSKKKKEKEMAAMSDKTTVYQMKRCDFANEFEVNI